MSAEWKMGQIAQGSPRCKARIAGFSYLLAVVAAVLGEFVIHGTLGLVLGLTAVACYVAVTLLMYVIFKPVSRVLCLFAVSFSLAGLILEALRWNPRGVDVAMVLHAAYCLLIGYLALRAAFLPRILGVPMMLAGFVWMTNLSPTLADSLAPYGTVAGLLGEAALMLWLLIFGLNSERWMEQAAARQWRSSRPMHA